MLKSGYDVFKYISISRLLHAAPVKYAASYQYTESDGMDLTYFLEYQAGVIKRALQNWQQHIDEITQRSAKLDSVLFSSGVLKRLNPRQVTLLNVMLANPGKSTQLLKLARAWASLIIRLELIYGQLLKKDSRKRKELITSKQCTSHTTRCSFCP